MQTIFVYKILKRQYRLFIIVQRLKNTNIQDTILNLFLFRDIRERIIVRFLAIIERQLYMLE